MDIRDFKDFKIEINPEEPLYIMSAVCRLVKMHEWTIRELDKKGLVKPKRKEKGKRLYSLKEIKKLEYIHYLMEDCGVNINGIRIILEKEIRE